MKGPLGGLADAPRQVNVWRINDDAFRLFIDADDAVERMLALFGFLLMAGQMDDFVDLLRRKAAVECDDARGGFVIDPPACRAQDLRPLFGAQRPLPTPVMLERSALRADRVIAQLLPQLIGVADVILLGVPGNTTTGGRPVRREIRLRHRRFASEVCGGSPRRVLRDILAGP